MLFHQPRATWQGVRPHVFLALGLAAASHKLEPAKLHDSKALSVHMSGYAQACACFDG